MSACPECRRRAWLLGALNGRLEYVGRAPARLAALLELADGELIAAVGGSESERLRGQYAQLTCGSAAGLYEELNCTRDPDSKSGLGRDAGGAPEPTWLPRGIQQICRHERVFPRVLASDAGAPRLLHVAGGIERLHELLAGPAVAIVGARGASDYGMEVAHGLARGLAASGVTVVSAFAEGIATAAHAGALEADGPTLTVAAGGPDVAHPARRRALYERVCAAGCALAELPCGERPRSWCHTARARIVVALAQLVVVVEAGERPSELLYGHLARDAGKVVAAVPGRVTSPRSRGTHVLLREGAVLVRDPRDVLDALYGVDTQPTTGRTTARRPAKQATVQLPGACRAASEPLEHTVPAPLRALFEAVATGRDTVAKLLAAGAAEPETLVGLAKLECSGALVRGDAGRYVARL